MQPSLGRFHIHVARAVGRGRFRLKARLRWKVGMAERESIWDLMSTLSSNSGLLGISAESLDLSGLSFLTRKGE